MPDITMDHVLAPGKGEQEEHILSTVENPLHQVHTTIENSVVEEAVTTKKVPNGRAHETTEWARDIFQLSGGTNKELLAKQQNIGRTVIVLLFVLGFAAGLINGVILLTNAALCSFQARLVVQGGYFGIGLLYFLVTMVSSVAVACMACRYGAREAAGSGLPEFKYLLASEMKRGDYDRLVSRRIFVFKVIGLIMSVGGGLSVGSEGPLVHTAGNGLLTVCFSLLSLLSVTLLIPLPVCYSFLSPLLLRPRLPLYVSVHRASTDEIRDMAPYLSLTTNLSPLLLHPCASACIAHLLMKYVIWFDEVLDSPSLTKQIMAASAAVGVSSAFNAPVGGLLFSVEVTSTYYLVANYWKSFIAAMAGSVACNLFLITKAGANSDPLLVLEMITLPPAGNPTPIPLLYTYPSIPSIYPLTRPHLSTPLPHTYPPSQIFHIYPSLTCISPRLSSCRYRHPSVRQMGASDFRPHGGVFRISRTLLPSLAPARERVHATLQPTVAARYGGSGSLCHRNDW